MMIQPTIGWRLFACVVLLSILSACGQKGPLKLPAPEPTTAPSAEPSIQNQD